MQVQMATDIFLKPLLSMPQNVFMYLQAKLFLVTDL